MTKWSLPTVLSALHDDVQQQLKTARKTFGHTSTKGDASENAWLAMLDHYLPARYSVAKAHVVDSKGRFSDQLDVVIFDRQYSPFVLHFNNQIVIPAESIYGVFEAKQEVDASQIKYTRQKLASVRQLHRTSLAIPHAGGTHKPKKPHHILGGLLTFDSAWKPPLGPALIRALQGGARTSRLDLGCVARHGTFSLAPRETKYVVTRSQRAATTFLFELIARLQTMATVPMLDVRAYAKWL